MLRHYLTLADGRIYFQDEELIREPGYLLRSKRTEWVQLPTPPSEPTVVGFMDYGGMPMAMRSDGQAFIWGRLPGQDVFDHWFPFKDRIPLNEVPEQ